MFPKLRPSWILAVALHTSGLVACSSESATEREPCPKSAAPSFRVEITAEEGALPEDVRVEVTYGAGYELYALDDSSRAGKSVLCETTEDASGVEAISCELWTSGAASLKVSATGYEPIDETLSAERDECGIKTTEVTRTLERASELPEP